ncbi:MAG: metallophosphatase family protein [Acidobacteriaceae bacterium]|nr:metallophosphatase family protein [Acidobacteriaceae bacterium]
MRGLILSDIHSNLEALTAVLEAAAPFDVVWNLGDVVGYGANPNEVMEIVRSTVLYNIRGNHDRICSGTDPALGFNPVAREAALWTRKVMTTENREWLLGGPFIGPLHLGRGVKPEPENHINKVALAHGSPLGEDEYILSMSDAWEPLQRATVPLTFIGHTHLQGGYLLKNRKQQMQIRPQYANLDQSVCWTLPVTPEVLCLINPGSVGQPRDSDWRAAFAIYDSEAEEIIFHRVPYDVAAAQKQILAAGLPERLAERLSAGR